MCPAVRYQRLLSLFPLFLLHWAFSICTSSLLGLLFAYLDALTTVCLQAIGHGRFAESFLGGHVDSVRVRASAVSRASNEDKSPQRHTILRISLSCLYLHVTDTGFSLPPHLSFSTISSSFFMHDILFTAVLELTAGAVMAHSVQATHRDKDFLLSFIYRGEILLSLSLPCHLPPYLNANHLLRTTST